MLTTLVLLVLSANPAPDALDRLAGALRASRGWRAAFAQEYIPEGFDTGTTERGTVTLAPPACLRFDYTSGAARIFATDGSVGRLVDPGAGTCDAVRLDAGVWARLPLSAVLDPGAARRAFVVEANGAAIRLTAATLAGVDSSFVLDHHLANTESVVLAPITDGRWSCLHWGSKSPPFYPEPDVHPVEDALESADPMG